MLEIIPNLTTAFQRVKENHGCAGVDGITIDEFENELNRNLLMLADEVKNGPPLAEFKV